MVPMGDTLATLGSRLSIVFDPVQHRILYPRYGRFEDLPFDLAIGVKLKGGKALSLPFTTRCDHFEFVEQTIGMNSIAFRGYSPDMGLRLVAEFVSPFYPRDARLSTAPVFYVDLHVEKLTHYRWRKLATLGEVAGEVFVELVADGIDFNANARTLEFAFESTPRVGWQPEVGKAPKRIEAIESNDFIVPLVGPGRLRAHIGPGRISAPFDLADAGDSAPLSMAWGTYTEQPVFSLYDGHVPFKYTEFFPTRQALVDYVVGERDVILAKSRFFESQFRNTGLGKSQEDFVAFTFHSFLMNTWWLRNSHGDDWFSVWEGSCYYHSTIDVEYNNALVYFALWPELLEMLLNQWAEFEQDGVQCLGDAGAGTTYLCHDMGSSNRAGEQHYHHPMEGEENCNYLLLAHAHWRFTGSDAAVRRHRDVIGRVARFLVACDTTGNGIPDQGVANTIDDASPAIQYGREQTYLGFKTMAALAKTAEMVELWDDEDSARAFRAQAEMARKTLDAEAWLGDHYAVTLNRTTEGMKDCWSGEPLPAGELKGWDAYSIYACNGLLYPMLCGNPCEVRNERFVEDTVSAFSATLREYGCLHSSDSIERTWISQNLWRDFVAGYLGVDMLNNADRYWAYQVTSNCNAPITCFYDTVGNNLCFYPRGITSIGVFFAACRFTLDRVRGVCTIRAPRRPMRLPMLALADWDAARIPTLVVMPEQGAYSCVIDGADAVTDVVIELTQE